jgi:hypothetical protein
MWGDVLTGLLSKSEGLAERTRNGEQPGTEREERLAVMQTP